MRVLTIERLRENPLNVLTCRMPKNPPAILLSLALFAADYCESAESVLASAVRKGTYVPRTRKTARNLEPIIESCADRAARAEKKIAELYQLRLDRSDKAFNEQFGRPD